MPILQQGLDCELLLGKPSVNGNRSRFTWSYFSFLQVRPAVRFSCDNWFVLFSLYDRLSICLKTSD